jgi:hypothetical protein
MIRCDLNNNLGPGGKKNDSLIKYINSRLGSMPNAVLSFYIRPCDRHQAASRYRNKI